MARLVILSILLAGVALGAPVQLANAQKSAAAAGDADAGEEIFMRACRTCHSGTIAPDLRGITGRKIASYSDFEGYSAKLKSKSSETWTDANLDAFLAAPTVMAPECVTPAIGDVQQRANLISFLKSLPPRQ